MRRVVVIISAFLISFALYAQEDVISTLHNDFESLDTIPQTQKYKSVHMLGVKYGYNISGVSATPDIGQSRIQAPLNISLLYTYYHALWDYMPNFGIQVGVKYGEEGYASKYEGYGERYKIVEAPLLSQFRIDVSKLRFIVNLGGYYGYRLSTDKEGGFDKYDIRHDYGIIGGAGLGIIFKPFEVQFEGNYKYSFCSVYHTNKYSDVYWLFAYPRNIMLSVSLFVHLW